MPLQGHRLVASPGSWTGSGTVSFAYQWHRCDTMGAHCVALNGVTTRGHRVGPNDVGRTLSLEVRATDKSGTSSAYASLVGPIAGAPSPLTVSRRPSISGDSVLGATLRVDPGTWRPKPSAFSFQWARCNVQGRACAPISGATGDSHEISAADLGHPLVAIVQARSNAAAQAVFSLATPATVRERGATGPSSTGMPVVATVVQQGKMLTGAAGAWSGSGAIRYTFSWSRCDAAGAHCTTIGGATAITYTPVAKDVGHTLGFAVRARDAIGAVTAYASLVGPVAKADATLASAGQPTIAGSPTQGQALQVTTGGWTQAPTSFAYQWQRCNENGRLCVPIAGATASSYTPAADDVGHALLAVVRATLGEATQDAVSATTRPIGGAPGPANTAPPAVSGAFQQGKQLTGSAGTWSGTGTIAYAFQWYRCDTAGAHCKSIHGATKATYTQAARDVGQTLGLGVRATDSTGTSTLFTSLVGPVAGASAKLVATAAPVVSGTAAQGQTLTVGAGAWSLAPDSVTYQWQRCNANGRLCTPIPDARAQTYVATSTDVGHSLVALVQAVAGGAPQTAFSTATAAVS